MRVNSIQNYSMVGQRGVYSNSVQNKQQSMPVRKSNIVQLTFTGKNMWQVASITPENNGLGLPEASQGGEGVVGYELPASLRKHEKVQVKLADGKVEAKPVDARSFMTFWEHNNPKGGYKFLIHKGIPKSELKDTMPASAFYSADLGEDIESVAKKLNVSLDEIDYVIQSRPNGNGPKAQSKYCLLEPTSVRGEVSHLSDTKLGETVSVPYRLFKVSEHNPSYNKLKGEPNYFIYTPQLARASKPYSYDCWGNVPFDAEVINSDGMKSLANSIHKQMDTEEFGHFNPASVLCHDRIANTYGNHIANMSAAGDTAVDGVKAHIIDHNTGRNYQGATGDPFKFLSVVGDETDAQAIKNSPYFDILQKARDFGMDSEALSPRERAIAHSVLDPVLAPFRDGAGTYNILKVGISSSKANPQNVSVGTVSHTFDSEMKSPETPDAAKFLTDDFASIQTKSVGNGVTPANMHFDQKDAKFGRGDNGLTKEAATGFTPFQYNGSNIDEVIAAKEKNARWLTNLIWEAGEKGQDELNKLFFNEGQIRDGHNVIGHLSPIKDGEILVFGFGRPDEQKGFPISTKGYLEFLKREDVPKETKQKVKLMLGAGPWNKDADDFKAIKHDLDEITKLDGGIYKNNVMYIDGFTPNRFTGCSHYGLFTSRREMYGITPIECKIAGTPYGSTKTGGPVDYTNPSNGFLTNDVVEGRPERYGLTWGNSSREIDQARVDHQAPQVGEIFKEMIEEYTDNHEQYVAKSKKNIEELVDWHNNSEYNKGKSANRLYLDDILETDKGWEARNKKPMNRVIGKLGEYKDELENLMHRSSSKTVKTVLAIGVGALAIAGGIYMYMNKSKQKVADATTPKAEPQKEQEAKPQKEAKAA